MIIDAKFKVGEKVYILLNGKITEGEVISFVFEKDAETETIEYAIRFGANLDVADRLEGDVFSSKQALIEAILDKEIGTNPSHLNGYEKRN